MQPSLHKRENSVKVFSGLRRAGLEFIKDIPWGTHLCGFYQSKNDLLNMLVPFFKAGLTDNEFCLLITSDPISPDDAIAGLEKGVPAFKEYLNRGQIEIRTHNEWYLEQGSFNGAQILDNWVKKERATLLQGYDGIRVCGNTTWLKKKHWKTFLDYENALNKESQSLNIIALCTYKLDCCGLNEIMELVNNHQFTFIHSKDRNSVNDTIAKFERLNLLGNMASTIAHEIRNPMTAVKGFLQLLQSKEGYKKDHDWFRLMIEELDRANNIIEEFLSLARNKSPKLQQLDLNRIIGALFPMIQADALKENKQAVLDLGSLEPLFVDRHEMSQLILNLVRNGLEAMSSGGTLTIKTYLDKDAAVLEIKDQGRGIPPDILEELGTPFVTTKENGTGLGLAVCYRIAERNNAVIEVDTGNSGTTFYVRFKQFREKGSNIA